MTDFEKCKKCADKERMAENKRKNDEYVANRKLADELAREAVIKTIEEKYGLTEKQGWQVYNLWAGYEDNRWW